MKGPSVQAAQTFDKPGWLRRFSTDVVDKDMHPADQRLLCHSVIKKDEAMGRIGEFRLVLDEGKNEFSFPPGSGLHVAAGQSYDLDMMLQNPDPNTDADYYLKVVFDIDYEGDGTALESLATYRVLIPAGDAPTVTGGSDWWLPPGRHEYSKIFTPPVSGSIRVMTAHLHEHATHISIKDLSANKVVWDSPVANDPGMNGFRIPVYSDKVGIPISKDRRYEFTATYNNPFKKRIPVMAVLHLFIHQDP